MAKLIGGGDAIVQCIDDGKRFAVDDRFVRFVTAAGDDGEAT